VKISSVHILCMAIFLCPCIQGQQDSAPTSSMAPKTLKTPYYIDPTMLNVGEFLPEPPSVESAANKAELAELHRIEAARTPGEIKKAKADDDEEDIFVFKTVFGTRFTPETLPLTAALGAHVKNEQSVVGNMLKRNFQRPRPYQTDNTLHPVCAVKTQHDSYPSGHSLTGYLEAFTLAELVPEKRTEILARADEYAYNRAVCGVHYLSDSEASRRVAYAVFGYMLATPKFHKDLDAAREEIRTKTAVGGQ
jgi:acid phosphatase (class A)